ncbi:YrbL family protein [Pectobacterium cacticida]|uniref:YrbL family protein n=1 Tax=Pectobacterium cacticida TaxID=69221 RepID=UPI0039860A27
MTIINLDRSLLISQGRHRACYYHPLMQDKCIKVHLNGESDRETIRELKYYQRIANEVFTIPIVSRYHGTVETNMGRGYIFDLIKDYTGDVSKTLEYYIIDNHRYEKYKMGIGLAWRHMTQWAKQYAIVTMTLKPYNIMYRLHHDDEGELIIIDNLGCANLFPLVYYSKYFARCQLSRRFVDFERLLCERYGLKFFPALPPGITR